MHLLFRLCTWLIIQWRSVLLEYLRHEQWCPAFNDLLFPYPKGKLCLHGACLPSRMRECRPVSCWMGPKWLNSVGTRRPSWRISARWVLVLGQSRFGMRWTLGKSSCVYISWELVPAFSTVHCLVMSTKQWPIPNQRIIQKEFNSKPQWAETTTWGTEIVIHVQELVHPSILLPLPGYWSLDLSVETKLSNEKGYFGSQITGMLLLYSSLLWCGLNRACRPWSLLFNFVSLFVRVPDFFFFRPCMLPRLSHMLKASCCWDKQPKNLAGHWITVVLHWCGGEAALSEGNWDEEVTWLLRGEEQAV